GRRQVEEGNNSQRRAQDDLDRGNTRPAGDNIADAIDRLRDARRRIEDLLQQLREEELERVLANLIARCQKMRDMQIAVYRGTQELDKTIQAQSTKVPAQADKTRGVRLSDDERAIAEEADKAIQMLQAEGSTVAFPDLFEQLREDMRHVQRRLFITDAGRIMQ